MTRTDPAVRRVLARLRVVRMEMRREGKLALQGRRINLRATDVQATWRLYDWAPKGER